MQTHSHTSPDPLTFEKVWLMFQKTDKKFQETDKKFQETELQLKKTDKKMNKLTDLFTGQWGKLMEVLVEPSSVSLFQERGIKINISARNMVVEDNKGNALAQFDIYLQNGNELVLIEVKTTCKHEDIGYFIKQIPFAKKHFPRHKIYGAIAALTFEAACDKHAYRQGLFVLKAGSKGLVTMLNDKKFKPKAF